MSGYPPQRSTPAEDGTPPLQFIVALLLSKSKPISLSIEGEFPECSFRTGKACAHPTSEYIASLRSCIIGGVRPEVSHRPDNHVDTTSFWREEHQKLEKAQVVLRAKAARVVELESELEKSSVSQIETPESGRSRSKRKRPAKETTSATIRKRARQRQSLQEASHIIVIDSITAPSVEDGGSSEESGIGRLPLTLLMPR